MNPIAVIADIFTRLAVLEELAARDLEFAVDDAEAEMLILLEEQAGLN